MRGVPLTPEQIARAAEVYACTGSYADAGRAIDVDESVARRALLRVLGADGESERVALHARACERGLRKARKRIARLSELAEKYTVDAVQTLSIEPRDLAAVLNANAKLVDSFGAIADRVERKQQNALLREKTAAEIRMLEARLAGTLPADKVEVTHDARDALAARLARLSGADGPRGSGEGDPQAQ